MNISVGDVIRITNVAKVNGGYMIGLREDETYTVVGVDDTTGCPAIMVNNYLFYFSKDNTIHISVVNKTNATTTGYFDVMELVNDLAGYVPPNNEINNLINKLEADNEARYLDTAINVALDYRDFHSLERLVRYI